MSAPRAILARNLNQIHSSAIRSRMRVNVLRAWGLIIVIMLMNNIKQYSRIIIFTSDFKILVYVKHNIYVFTDFVSKRNEEC
jgi:hypothetical protein